MDDDFANFSARKLLDYVNVAKVVTGFAIDHMCLDNYIGFCG